MGGSSEKFVARLLERCDIRINGDRAWDVRVHDRRIFDRVLTQGTLGLGEAYMDGWWDAERVDAFIYRLLTGDAKGAVKLDLSLVGSVLRGTLLNLQRWRPGDIGKKHYDISDALYEAMLDRRMIYSCGYWQNAADLDAAQEAKLDLICRKIGLAAGDTVLDIGAGWGGFLKYAAQNYAIAGTGVTVSQHQAEYARESFAGLPLEMRLIDYRDLKGRFDHIVSVGMFEHVGHKNYRAYMEKAHELLDDGGLFLLHTIGGNHTQNHGDPWSEKYIFPNGMLPSIKQVGTAIEGLFVMEDWHNFSAYYDDTLMAWHANFEAAWPALKAGFDERFYRMWRYYLLSFAAAFRARNVQLWQIVLSKNGVKGGYRSIR